MFDNLRQKSQEEAEFLNIEDPDQTVIAKPKEKAEQAAKPVKTVKPLTVRRAPRRRSGGVTPFQGFVLALMLFLNVSVLGVFALLVFEKIALPFF
jgi:hypothetical protein